MIGRTVKSGAALVVALLAAAPVLAQPSTRGRQPKGGRGGGPPRSSAMDFVGVREAFEGKRVKGVPYQAQVVTEFVQTLGDGNRIVRKTTASVARDSEGRTRREQTIAAIGPMVPSSEPPRTIFIHDPVAEVSYMLDADHHTARKLGPRPEHEGGGAPPPEGGPKHFGPPPWGHGPGGEKGERPAPETESLGKQMIEGVEAEGTRYTFTIAAGAFGNEKPIQIVSERWYSPELQVMVQSKHRDPRFGETTFRLTGITRGEPDKSLFEVPADYKVEEGPPPRGFGRDHMRPQEEEDLTC